MATQAATIAHMLDTLSALPLTSRKMFGEYALYLDGVVVALICDDQLWIKPTPGTAEALADCPPGEPFPGAKRYLCADALLDDPETTAQLLHLIAAERPPPKPRKRKS